MLRPIPLGHYLATMQAIGIPAEKVILNTAIDLRQIQNPEYLVEFDDYHRLVENMIELAGNEDVGLDVGLSSKLTDFGILGHAALSCHSVRQSIDELWTVYGDTMGLMTRFGNPDSDDKTLTIEITAPRMSFSVYRFCIEEALGILLTLGRVMTGEAPQISKLEFSYPTPLHVARYQELFHCPLSFSAQATRITILQRWLDGPLKTRDDELNKLYQQHLALLQRQIEHGSPIKTRIKDMLMRRGGTFPLLEDIGRELGIGSRTLRRLLQQQGSSYRELVQECRTELAQGWLRSSRRSVKDIGHQLGFDDVNAFRRAFKVWTSKTVTEYRRSIDQSI